MYHLLVIQATQRQLEKEEKEMERQIEEQIKIFEVWCLFYVFLQSLFCIQDHICTALTLCIPRDSFI